MRSFFPWATLFTGTTVAGNHRTDSCCRHFAACCMDRSLGVQGERPDQILCERPDFLHQFVQETVPGRKSDRTCFPAEVLRQNRCTERRAELER